MANLRPSLGVISLSFYGIGMILGAGIYSVIGPAAGIAGEALWISFVLSSFVALLTCLSYAELAAMYPNAGGEYAYFTRAYPQHPWFGFMAGLTMVTVNSATSATVAIAFAGYFQALIQSPNLLIAFLLILLVTLINVIGIQTSSRVNILLTLIEAAGLLLVIYLGIDRVDFTEAFKKMPFPEVVTGAAVIFFSYLGFENIINLAEEARHPTRDLPRAIILSLIVTSFIYILIGFTVVALWPPANLAKSEAPLVDALAHAWPNAATTLGFIALFSTANTALIGTLTGSRILFAMARDKKLPPAMAQLFAKRGTPWLASLVIFGVTSALLLIGELKTVASLTSLCSLLAFLGVHSTVIMLRFRRPDFKRPFRVPLTLGKLPLIPCFGVISTSGLLTQFEAEVYWGGAVVIGAAFVVYGLRRKF